MTKELPLLRGERVLLRLATVRDAEAIARFYTGNQAFHAPTSPAPPDGFFTPEFHRLRAIISTDEFLNAKSCRLLVFADEKIVGTANFTQFIHAPFHACRLGYLLGKDAEGKGLMSEALRLAIPYVFQKFRIHRIEANHLPENERSARVLSKLGFTREGYAKEYLRIGGRWQDHVLNSLINPQWSEPDGA